MTRTASNRRFAWPALAALLGERAAKPTFVLDAKGLVTICNTALEEILGRSRNELIGRSWIDTVVPREESDTIRRRLEDALSGRLERCECPVETPNGRRSVLAIEVAVLGSGRTAVAIATVLSVQTVSAQDEAPLVQLKYEIGADTEDFGRLRRPIPEVTEIRPEARCYEVLHQRDRPCAGCPALLSTTLPIRFGVISSTWRHSTVAIMVAATTGDGARAMTAYFLDSQLTRGISQARLMRIADATGLSERELEVLKLLALGRSPDEISIVLDIAARTVKFHQSNILSKIGADSRFDLIRLLA